MLPATVQRVMKVYVVYLVVVTGSRGCGDLLLAVNFPFQSRLRNTNTNPNSKSLTLTLTLTTTLTVTKLKKNFTKYVDQCAN